MESFLAERERLIGSAEPGIAAARELATIADEAVRELCRTASVHPRGRWALVALGGWGAGALLPKSDLDLLVLADARSEQHKPFIEAILYPLWDAGLKVGHQTRTPKEQSRAMREDMVTMTAALTARPIAGDTSWAARVMDECAASATKRGTKTFARLAGRERPGSPYLLEPQLKEGRGGRRDYDELVWSAAACTGTTARDASALVASGMLGADELAAVCDAADTIAAARWVMQRAGHGDLMTLEAAGLLADPEAAQRALVVTALTCDRVRARLSAPSHVESRDPLSAEDVFALLDSGSAVLPALEEAAASGRLDALVPTYSTLMYTRRPGLGHELTVGAHCLKAAALLADVRDDPGALGRSSTSVIRPRALQVATLTHDIGKLEGGAGHPERGSSPARDAARAFGLDAEDADEVCELVRLHLELPETALRADIDDEDAVLRAAARVGRRELVAPLHVLTAVDSMATGPATWNDWVAVLVTSLASRLDAALSDEVDGAGIVARGESVRAAVLAAAGQDAAVRSFAEQAPLRYLASREPAEVASQARLLAELEDAPHAERVAVSVRHGAAPGIESVTVAAPDRPELFARIAGALALSGLDILAADAYAAPNGLALDSFTVTSATLRAIDTSTWQAFDRYLRASLRDRLELETRLAERRRHYGSGASAPVTVETDASAGYHTTVRVTAPDRPGLLYDVARAVSESGLDIRWARAVTVEGMALDTFHVTGADGSSVTDPGVLGHLAMRLRDIG